MLRFATLALAVVVAPATGQERRPVRPDSVRAQPVVPPSPRVEGWPDVVIEPDVWLDMHLPDLIDLEWQQADALALNLEVMDHWRLEGEVADALARVEWPSFELADGWRLEAELDAAQDAMVDAQVLALELGDEWRAKAELAAAEAFADAEALQLGVLDPGRVEQEMDAAREALERAARTEDRLRTTPRAPWAPGDQADSLYKSARQALTRGDYQRAAEWFRLIPERYPQSAYAPDALYWEAFARYRMGTTPELRAALQALERQQARYAEAATRADAATLATRIRGALAARGDREAAAQLEREAAQGAATCDEEDMAVRVEAFNALAAMEPAASDELFTRILARRDECSAPLRRRAVLLLGRRADSTAANLLIDVARNDPDPDVRAYAIRWLGRAPGARSLATLEELGRRSDDERAQREAVRALARHSNPQARASLRALIENPGVSERVRSDAIAGFSSDATSPEDAAWLRTVYPRLDSERLKGRVISTVSRLEGAENTQWLLEIARSPSEPVDLRAAALSACGRRDAIAIEDLVRLYDVMTERRLREQLIGVYGRRDEPQATDQLIAIVRTGTDPRLRRSAISALTKKKDPRTQRLLMELIDQ